MNEQPQTRTPLPLPTLDEDDCKDEKRGGGGGDGEEVELQIKVDEGGEVDSGSTGVGPFVCPCAMTILKQCGGQEDLLRCVRSIIFMCLFLPQSLTLSLWSF